MALARSNWLDSIRRRLQASFSKFAPPQVLKATARLGHRIAR